MRTTVNQKLKAGIVILAGLLLLFVLIFVIGSQRDLFSRKFSVSGVFKNVSGLKPGAFVRLAGINVGTVEDVEIISDSTVRVMLKVDQKTKKFIRADALLSIVSDGLMGDKLVCISGGTPSAPIVYDNQELQVKNPMDMEQLMTRVNSIVDGADQVVTNIASISNKLNNGEGSLGRLLNSDGLTRKLESTIAAANSTASNASDAAQGFSDNMERIKHSFLFRGYFRKKEAARIKDSISKTAPAGTKN